MKRTSKLHVVDLSSFLHTTNICTLLSCTLIEFFYTMNCTNLFQVSLNQGELKMDTFLECMIYFLISITK